MSHGPWTIKHAASIKHQASSIKNQASSIKHQASSIKFYQGQKLNERSSVAIAQPQPRASKGITDLSLPQTSLR
jgi:hypothetical protein